MVVNSISDLDCLVPGCKLLTWGDQLKGRSRYFFDADGSLVVESMENQMAIYEYANNLVLRGVCGEDGKRKTNSQNYKEEMR